MTGSLFRSAFDDIDIPPSDLPTYFLAGLRSQRQFARSDSPRPVFIDGSSSAESLTLAQFERLTHTLASGLYHHLGVRAQDAVLVALPNSTHYLAVTTAVLLVGGVCSLANPLYTESELAHQLAHSRCRFIVTAASALARVQSALVGYPTLPLHHVLCVDRQAPCGVRSVFDVLCEEPFPQLRLRDHGAMRRTPAFICYSGGTTGLPKGVVLSHYNIVANVQQGRHVQAMMEADGGRARTTLAVLPMFHSFGLVLTAHSLPLCGSALLVMPKFDFAGFLRLVETHRVTDTLLVPPIINMLAKTPQLTGQYDLSSLRWIISGAAPLSPRTAAALEQRLPHVRVLQGYGLTETSPGLALNTPTLCDACSSGPLLPSAKVLDAQGRCLGPGDTGELCFRGPNVMLGYLDDPQETARCIDPDGFFHTGDLGFIDAQGFVHVTDRIKELIKYNGFQVAPAELEGILMQHARVKDCAVVGVFDEERQTELPRAYVVLDGRVDEAHEGVEAAARHVRDWVDAQVVYYKRLRGGCFVVEAIPRTASGKILRRNLRDIIV
ncbi:hypothetical protein GGI15_002558 [Coemansia interrupta]|uniref:Uncharacterized protein n=1 Tax=Coemansia interrupta TaxID=1126814 RepID=A0A9W8HEA8_9FUNG|nr:hypothetical protein GGI15_002558 [Coemansia interrupta]